MKMLSAALAAVGLLSAAPAFAAPVTMTFQNVGTVPMQYVSTNACGTFSPTPTDISAGGTSASSSTDCGSAASAAHVTYKMGTKQCVFHISTIYTPGNPILGTSGYWTPSASVTQSGGATCKVVSQDISNVFTTGAFAAVYSMK